MGIISFENRDKSDALATAEHQAMLLNRMNFR